MATRKRCPVCKTMQAVKGASSPWNKVIDRHRAPCGRRCVVGLWAIEVEGYKESGEALHSGDDCEACKPKP